MDRVTITQPRAVSTPPRGFARGPHAAPSAARRSGLLDPPPRAHLLHPPAHPRDGGSWWAPHFLPHLSHLLPTPLTPGCQLRAATEAETPQQSLGPWPALGLPPPQGPRPQQGGPKPAPSHLVQGVPSPPSGDPTPAPPGGSPAPLSRTGASRRLCRAGRAPTDDSSCTHLT